MPARTTPFVTAAQAKSKLSLLLVERQAALRTPLAGNRAYMADLEADIAASQAAFVGWAITELAILRASLFGRPQG